MQFKVIYDTRSENKFTQEYVFGDHKPVLIIIMSQLH